MTYRCTTAPPKEAGNNIRENKRTAATDRIHELHSFSNCVRRRRKLLVVTTPWTQLSPPAPTSPVDRRNTHTRTQSDDQSARPGVAGSGVERVKNTVCVNLTFNPVRCWCRSDCRVYNATNRGRQLSRRPWFMVAVAAAHDQPPAISEDRANTARQTVRSVRCPPLSRTLEIFDCWQPFRLPYLKSGTVCQRPSSRRHHYGLSAVDYKLIFFNFLTIT